MDARISRKKINLFDETSEILKQNGKTWDDVVCVGSADGFVEIDEFIRLAKNTDYDNGWGLNQIPLDLRLELDDIVIVRREYDGKEWWEAVKFQLVNRQVKLRPKTLVQGLSERLALLV